MRLKVILFLILTASILLLGCTSSTGYDKNQWVNVNGIECKVTDIETITQPVSNQERINLVNVSIHNTLPNDVTLNGNNFLLRTKTFNQTNIPQWFTLTLKPNDSVDYTLEYGSVTSLYTIDDIQAFEFKYNGNVADFKVK